MPQSSNDSSSPEEPSIPEAAPVEPLSLKDRLRRARENREQEPDKLQQTWIALPVENASEDDDFNETPTIALERQHHNPSGIQSEGSADEMRQAIARMRAKRREQQ